MQSVEPVLRVRLDALEINLLRIGNPSAIRKEFGLRFTEEYLYQFTQYFNREFWEQFEVRLKELVEDKLAGIRRIRALLDALDASEAETAPAERAGILDEAWNSYSESRQDESLEGCGGADERQGSTDRAVVLQCAWIDYSALREQCQEIFLEFHDVIAGLVFREKAFEEGSGFEPAIFYAADELMTFCASNVSLLPSLTVPSPRETLARTLGRIVRMRYSEWTVWSLPLVAHEFAHVVLSEPKYEKIMQIFDPQLRSELIQLNPERAEALNPEPEDNTRRTVQKAADKQVEKELRYYLADAWGTWVLGPAYAYAAIHHRLNPGHVSTIDTSDFFDHERAEVIFGVLGNMAESRYAGETFGGDEIKAVVRNLRDTVWKGMVSRANLPGEPETVLAERRLKQRAPCLQKIVDQICRKFSSIALFRSLMYTRVGTQPSQGWASAKRWSDEWSMGLGKAGPSRDLPPIKVDGTRSIRDALNAGWLCREARPQDLDRIERALRDLCRDIFVWRLRDPGGGFRGPVGR